MKKDLEENNEDGSNNENESAEENDADYYRQEVGENPDPELFPHAGKKRKRVDKPSFPTKRKRPDVSKINQKDEKHFNGKGKQTFKKFDKKTGKLLGKEKTFSKQGGRKNPKKSKPPGKKGKRR